MTEPIPERPPPAERRARGGLVLGAVLAAAVVVLAAQNTRRTSVHFLLWRARAPLVVVIAVTALAGVLVDELVGFLWRRRRHRQPPD